MSEEDVFGDAGLDAVDTSEIDAATLEGFGEVTETIEFPHIKIATKSLKKFADISKVISVAGGRDVVSKAVCLEAVDGHVVCRATDFDIYVEQSYELMNQDNVLRDTVVINTDILLKLMKAAPASTVIYKKEDKFYIRLFGGDVILESFDLKSDKFTFQEAVEEVGTVSSHQVYTIAKNYSGVVSAAVSSVERRIAFSKNGAFAKYMWALLGTRGSFFDFDLKPKDISIVRAMLVNTDEDLSVAFTKEGKSRRCKLTGNGFSFSFLLSDIKIASDDEKSLEKPDSAGFHVDLVQLYKIVELAADLPYALGKVKFAYEAGSGITLNIATRKGSEHQFNISGNQDGNIADDLQNNVTIQAKLLRIVLRTFAGQTTVKVSILGNEIVVSTEDRIAIIASETK